MIEFEKINYKIPVDVYQLNDEFFFQEENKIYRINSSKEEVYNQSDKFVIMQTNDKYLLIRTKNEIILLEEIDSILKIAHEIPFHNNGSRQYTFISNNKVLFKEFTGDATEISIYNIPAGYSQTLAVSQGVRDAFIAKENIVCLYDDSIQVLTKDNTLINELDLSQNLKNTQITFSAITSDFIFINAFYKDRPETILFKINPLTGKIENEYKNLGVDLLLSESNIYSVKRKTNEITVLDINTDAERTIILNDITESYIETQCKPRIKGKSLIICLQDRNSEFYNKWILLDSDKMLIEHLELLPSRLDKNEFFISQFYLNSKRILIQADYEWYLYAR